MISPTAIKDWDRIPVSDRPRYAEALKRLMKRDPRAIHQMKKMDYKGKGQHLHARFHVTNIYSVRASREHRVFLTPEDKDFRLLGFAARGDNRYYHSEA